MKILVLGGGGREHAIIRKLRRDGCESCDEIFCAPGNGGISRDATCVPVKCDDVDAVLAFAAKEQIDYVIAAPEAPLVVGMVDALAAKGIPAFGPSASAARIEGSKVFSKALMQKYGIPTAAYAAFTDEANALAYIVAQGKFPVVIKADGLALGKGVIIAQDLAEAQTAISSIMSDKIFGESGSSVVVEEFLTGPEVSVLAFCDGVRVAPMISAMDHKRAYDGNKGPNTGGMGTVAPNPHYTPEIAEICMRTIFRPTMDAMVQEGAPFKGCLFFGLMLTPDGPKVIEYNCRFGDPETQVVLELMASPLLPVMQACTDGTLDAVDLRWQSGAAVCVAMASGGYPEKYEVGKCISGLDADGGLDGASIYHAGTRLENGDFLTAGGRVLGVTARGESLEAARENAYAAVKKISWDGAFCRSDLGKY